MRKDVGKPFKITMPIESTKTEKIKVNKQQISPVTHHYIDVAIYISYFVPSGSVTSCSYETKI